MGAVQMEPVHRKVMKIGNSLGVTFNKELLKRINVDLGDDLEIIVNENEGEVVLRNSPKVPQGLDPRFFEVLQANVDQYRKTIEGLKDR